MFFKVHRDTYIATKTWSIELLAICVNYYMNINQVCTVCTTQCLKYINSRLEFVVME